MKSTRFRNSLAVIAALAAIAATPHAQAEWEHHRQAVAMLPDYCKYTLLYRNSEYGSMDPAPAGRWKRLMGPENFMHMHHYCRGLEHTNIALHFARSKQQRDQNLGFSIREFDYVIRNVKPHFTVLPEIHTKKGENLMRLGRAPEAILALGLAIERKADYWPPYAALSDYYREQRDYGEARQWLKKGLAAAPDALPLKDRLAELEAGDGRRKVRGE